MNNKIKSWIFRAALLLILLIGVAGPLILNVQPAYAANKYWVGGSGDWSQTAHWSLASGGAGGAAVPTSGDAVFFDGASFTAPGQTFTIANTSPVCASLDMTGSGAWTPVFGNVSGGSNSDLSVYGSITWSAGITFENWGSGTDTISIHSTSTLTGCTWGTALGSAPRLVIEAGANTVTLANDASATSFTKTSGTFTIGANTFTSGSYFLGAGQTYSGTVILDFAAYDNTQQMTGANQFNDLTLQNDSHGDCLQLDSNITITGTLTLDGNSATNRGALQSNTTSQRTVTAANVVADYWDFYYIVGAGAGDWDLSTAGENAIDFGNNSGITFWLPYDNSRDMYWTGLSDGSPGSGAWASSDTDWTSAYNWSTTSGGVAGAARVPRPTSTNDCFFDANSGFTLGNIDIIISGVDVYIPVHDLDFTGCGAVAAPRIWNQSGANYTILDVYGDLIMEPGMTGYVSSGVGDGIRLSGSGDIYMNGFVFDQGMGNLQVNTAGTYTFHDDLNFYNYAGCIWWLVAGTVDFTTHSASIYYTGTATRSFYGGGQTYYEFNDTSVGTTTINGENNFTYFTRHGNTGTFTDSIRFAADQYINNLTLHGFNSTYRLLVGSSVAGTQRQISVSTSIDVCYCDISDTAGVGAAGWDISSCLNQDMGGNIGITFTTGIYVYWVGNSGSWSDVTNHWSSTSGGPPGTGRIPLIQDVAVFDDHSFSIPGRTVTIDITNLSGIDAEDVTNTPTISKAGTVDIYGDVLIGSLTWNVTTTRFTGLDTGIQSSSVFNTTFTVAKNPVYMSSLFLGGNITVNGQVVVSSGIFNHNGWDLTALTYDSSTTTYDRGIRLGSGVTTLNSTAATTKWNMNATKLNLFCETSTLILSNSGTNGQTFAGGGLTYNNITQAGAGVWTMTVSGTNTCYQLKIDRSQASKTISGAVTITMQAFDLALSGTNTITITNTDFTMASGVVLGDYLIISGSAAGGGATFFANVGGHSTNNGGNSGWIWTPPTAPTVDTLAASDISEAGATLNGELLTTGSYITFTCYFQYGPTIAYGYETTDYDTLTATGLFDGRISPFHPYHYRAVVEFGLNDHVYGDDMVISLTGAVKQAKAAKSDPGEDPGDVLVSDAPDPIPGMYDESGSGFPPLAPIIDPALSEADMPNAAFWMPIAFVVAIILGFVAFGFTRNLLVQCLVSGITMAGFAGGGVLGSGILPYLTVVVFGLEAVLVLIIQEKQHV